jgi:hypothetical protein
MAWTRGWQEIRVGRDLRILVVLTGRVLVVPALRVAVLQEVMLMVAVEEQPGC